MRTLRRPTPFDDPRRQAAVATPSCCCCCCCCLVTTATSTTMAAVYVNELALGRERTPGARAGLCAAAVVGMLCGIGGLITTAVGILNDAVGPSLLGVALAIAGAGLLALTHAAGQPLDTRDLGFAAVALFTAAAFFAFEFVTVGFLLVGQVLALPVPIAAGLYLRRRLRNRP